MAGAKGTRYGQPFVGSRYFNGKRYVYLTYEVSLREAQKRAEYQRKAGGHARVTKEKSPGGKTIYVVWATLAQFKNLKY